MAPTPPSTCPECGGSNWKKRYSTGGGWRVTAFVCESCGHRVPARS